MSLAVLLVLSLVLGCTSFVIGILPLSLAFSRLYVQRLSTLGTGLLIGAALGVIIPEAVEAIYESKGGNPSSSIALSLLGGFSAMLVLEQLLSPHSHHYEEEAMQLSPPETPYNERGPQKSITANPMTVGLVIHSLADGFALGASSLPVSADVNEANPLTLIVFLALLMHRAPAALALSTSLLPHLPRSQIRTHVAIFSLASPLGAVLSYALLNWFGSEPGWTGIALAISGGTFLYVATVLSPVREEGDPASETRAGKLSRIGLVLLGMAIPVVIGKIFGHGHEPRDHHH